MEPTTQLTFAATRLREAQRLTSDPALAKLAEGLVHLVLAEKTLAERQAVTDHRVAVLAAGRR